MSKPAYLTPAVYAARQNLSRSRIHILLLAGRIPGAMKMESLGTKGQWMIPVGAKIEPHK